MFRCRKSSKFWLVSPNTQAVAIWCRQTLVWFEYVRSHQKTEEKGLWYCTRQSSTELLQTRIPTPLSHPPPTAHITFAVKKIWLTRGSMITNDGVDDDGDADNNDQDNIEGAQHTWSNSSSPWFITYSAEICPNLYISDVFPTECENISRETDWN